MGLGHAWWSHLSSGRQGRPPFPWQGPCCTGQALLAGGAQHLAMCGWRGEVCLGSPSSLLWGDGRFFSAEVLGYWFCQLLLGSGLWTSVNFILPDISVHGRSLNNLWADVRVWLHSYISRLQKLYKRCLFLSFDCQHLTQHSHRVGKTWNN